MKRPVLSLIAAVPRNGVIGRGNELVWRESEDQKHFRALTMGSPVIMGRKTWDSLPARFRPLPGRRNIVITRNDAWQAEGAEGVGSMAAALDLLQSVAKAYVIGGAEIYALALPLADELELTEIDAELDGDAFFPAWNRADFGIAAREPHIDTRGTPYTFTTYKRNGRP